MTQYIIKINWSKKEVTERSFLQMFFNTSILYFVRENQNDICN